MYDALIYPGEGLSPIDPSIEAGQGAHKTVLGTGGVSVLSIKNLHGVQCHDGDNRISDSPVDWGNHCAGAYDIYVNSVEICVWLLNREYFSEGPPGPGECRREVRAGRSRRQQRIG